MDNVLKNIINTITRRRVAMIGSGSWATALVKVLSDNGLPLMWYIRRDEVISSVRETSHNPDYLPDVELDTGSFTMTSDINEAVRKNDVLIFCIPSAYFIRELSRITVPLEGKMIISAIKGFVTDECYTVAEYFHQVLGIPYDRLAVISGPCHSEEVSRGKLSYITVSSKYRSVASSLASFFRNKYIMTVSGTDIYGVEYAAALKNVYALGAGIVSGTGYGDNFLAVFITNCYHELDMFIRTTHPMKDRDTSVSAYMGDLLVTCYSQFSRNRSFGMKIGQGLSVGAAMSGMKMVAEGYYAARAMHTVAMGYGVKMPIAEMVYSILYLGVNPSAAVRELTEKLL